MSKKSFVNNPAMAFVSKPQEAVEQPQTDKTENRSPGTAKYSLTGHIKAESEVYALRCDRVSRVSEAYG